MTRPTLRNESVLWSLSIYYLLTGLLLALVQKLTNEVRFLSIYFKAWKEINIRLVLKKEVLISLISPVSKTMNVIALSRRLYHLVGLYVIIVIIHSFIILRKCI